MKLLVFILAILSAAICSPSTGPGESTTMMNPTDTDGETGSGEEQSALAEEDGNNMGADLLMFSVTAYQQIEADIEYKCNNFIPGSQLEFYDKENQQCILFTLGPVDNTAFISGFTRVRYGLLYTEHTKYNVSDFNTCIQKCQMMKKCLIGGFEPTASGDYICNLGMKTESKEKSVIKIGYGMAFITLDSEPTYTKHAECEKHNKTGKFVIATKNQCSVYNIGEATVDNYNGFIGHGDYTAIKLKTRRMRNVNQEDQNAVCQDFCELHNCAGWFVIDEICYFMKRRT